MQNWRNNELLINNFNTFEEVFCNKIVNLEYSIDYNDFYEEIAKLTIKFIYDRYQKKYVTILFTDVETLDMKGGFFPFFQVMGLQIVDQLERGLECRYEISDEDGGAIYFTCQEITILEVSEVI